MAAAEDPITASTKDSLKGHTRTRVSFAHHQNKEDHQPSPEDLLPLPMTPEDPVYDDHEEEQDLSKNNKDKKKKKVDYVLIALRSPAEQLKSQQYILIVAFYMFHVARIDWTLTTSRDWLASLGDDELDNKYLTIFISLSVVSISGLPFIDHLLEHYGYHVGFQVINLLGMIHGMIQVSGRTLNVVHIVGFLVFSFYRCFTFVSIFSFISIFLSGSNIGRGAGIMTFGGAVFSFVNLGLSAWVVNGLKGDFWVVNFLYTVFVVPLGLVAWRIGRCIHREDYARQLVKDSVALRRSSYVSIQLSRHIALLGGGGDDENDDEEYLLSDAESVNAGNSSRKLSVHRGGGGGGGTVSSLGIRRLSLGVPHHNQLERSSQFFSTRKLLVVSKITN
jgi:hypothetical protein